MAPPASTLTALPLTLRIVRLRTDTPKAAILMPVPPSVTGMAEFVDASRIVASLLAPWSLSPALSTRTFS